MGSQSLQHRSREQQYEGNMNKVTIQQYQPPLPIQIPSSQSSRAPQTGRCLIQTKGQRSTDAYQEQVGACLHKVMLWKIFFYLPLAHSSMREPGAALPRARQSREVGCAAQHQGMALIFLAWPRNAGTEVPDQSWHQWICQQFLPVRSILAQCWQCSVRQILHPHLVGAGELCWLVLFPVYLALPMSATVGGTWLKE